MSDKNISDENISDEVISLSLDDFPRASRILKKALAERPFLTDNVCNLNYDELTVEQRTQELLEPRMGIVYLGENKETPSIFMRIVGETLPTMELVFYPLESVALFLGQARRVISSFRKEDWTDEVFENAVDHRATQMTLLMVDNLYQRFDLMRTAYSFEVIGQWAQDQAKAHAEFLTANAQPVRRPKKTLLRTVVTEHAKEILEMWQATGKEVDNSKKLQFAREYPAILRHWKKLERYYSRLDVDWREYAKAGRFHDTPDDLLKRLEYLDRSGAEKDRVSHLALEHAARRVGLLKITQGDRSLLNKRRAGTNESGYSESYLFECLREGRLLEQRARKSQELKKRLATYPILDS